MSPHLSLDIQVEIVKWLPVKSLMQFRSVCKAWKLLIDSPRFIAGYNVCHNHLLISYDVGYGKDWEVKHVSFVDDDAFPHQKFALTVPPLLQEKPTMMGSSHGLLGFIDYYQESEKLTQMVVLWNPAIRKSIAVVVPDNNNNVVDQLFSYVVGFGVCPDTKDPKLVKITYIHDFREMESIISIPCQVMVFTLSSGKWTTSSCTNLPHKSIEFTSSHTVIGQFIYWLAFDRIYVDVGDGDGDGEYRSMIMSFDMSTEEFREIELPYSFDMCDPEDLFVSRLRESLVVVKYTIVVDRYCDVWMMEHGDFTKLFSINVSGWTMGFRKSGEPIVQMKNDNKDFNVPYALVLYEPCSEHIRDLGIRLNGHSFSVETYTESLLLLDHEDGHIVRCGVVQS